jgi:hypothetical protein
MKPALALKPVHWQGEVVGHIRKFDSRRLLNEKRRSEIDDFTILSLARLTESLHL